MSLLIAYLAALVVGQGFAVSLGLIVERLYSSYAGLVVFIPLYFLVFYLAWRFAVRITEPRT
jgi:hypothetical protein